MDTNEEKVIEPQVDEEIVLEEVEEEPKPEPKEKPKLSDQEKYERFQKAAERYAKKLGINNKKEVETPQNNYGNFDNGDYALLATKGIEDGDSRIEFLKDKAVKWKMPLRELLKDEDIQAKLKSMKIEGDVANATPSSTRRGQSVTSDTEDYWYSKYLNTGELPKNMPQGMAQKLVNRRFNEENVRQNPFE